MSILKNGILLTKRGFLVNAILFFYFFTLYFVFSFNVIRHAIPSADNRLIVQSSFNFVLAIALLSISFLIQKINKLSAIYACSLVSSTIAVLLFFASNDTLRLIFIFIVGICLGIGQLASSTYFWDLTVPEERGRIGGLIGFVSLPFYYAGAVLAETLDFPGTVMLSVILSLGILTVMLLRSEKAVLTAKRNESESYPEKRTILMYSIPWIMFSVINSTIAKNISVNTIQQVSSSFYFFLNVLQLIGTLFGALSGGIIADFFGRRLSLAFSLTLYGISSALAGLVNNNVTFCFVYISNGLSWGTLLTLYSFVIWGDLASKENCAKMYSIGLMTLYLTTGVGLLTPISQVPLVASSLVSCFLIFFSNVPLALAPELLSSDFRERIKLRLHMRAVRKIGKQSQNQG
jgi:MFS family permease